MVLTNTYFSWVSPDNQVDCYSDSLINFSHYHHESYFFQYLQSKAQIYGGLISDISILIIAVDLIFFLRSSVFAFKTFLLFIFNAFQILLYNHYNYDAINTSSYSLTIYNGDGGLYSFPLSVVFQGMFEYYRLNQTSKVKSFLRMYLILILIVVNIGIRVLLINNFCFQIVFAFIAPHLLKLWLD